MKNLCLLATFIFVSCSQTTDLNELWERAYEAGHDKIFHAKIKGKQQCVVLVFATAHSESEAERLAYKKGLALLSSEARMLDMHVVHSSDDECVVHMLVTLPR